MANTLLLDIANWDLVLDASGNIAVASEPYSLAQDAASSIKTFFGECYWDTTIGVPYMTQVFGQNPSLSSLKTILAKAALATLPTGSTAVVFITAVTARGLSGQVQVTSPTGQVSAASFTAITPQGIG